MREWRLRTAQRSFYRPANCAAESVRGTRPIVARKKIAIGVSIGALDFMQRGVEKFPPGSYGWSVTKNRIPGDPTRIADQGRSLGRPILVGTQRESRYGRSLAGPDRFPGDATEGISTIEIESQSRAHPKSSFFVWQPVSEMPRFRVDNLAHEPPCSPHDRRRKNLFPAEKRRYSRDTSILQHTFFEHHTTNPKQKWPALPPPSPAPSRPSRRPRSRCASTLCHAFSGGPKRSSVNLPAHHPSSERFDRVAEARWRAVRAHRVRRSSRFNS